MARLWLIRLGRNGEYEARALEEGVLTVGFGIRHDVSPLKDRGALEAEMARLFPDDKPNRHRNFAAQVNQFLNVAETGDLVVSTGSVVVGSDDGDVRAYLSSLRRLYARNPDRLYPGHGPVIETPRDQIERLIRHRLDREAKILTAVRDGARTLDEVLDTAYDKDLSGVRDLARTTTAAHLEKLAVEGEVEWNGERATPTAADE